MILDNELFHGFLAGIGQSLVGHPFDTYKTWIQTKHNEKISLSGLYRGFTYPAFTNGIITGISFHAYTYYKNKDEKYGMIKGGIMAGLLTTILCAYPEYKKIFCQINRANIPKFPKQSFVTLSCREILAGVAYYPVYDLLRNNNNGIITSGGLAGCSCWIVSYWCDVLNTKVMNGNSLSCALKTTKFIDYFKGLEIVLPRAFLVNATGYYFYELSKEFLG